MKGMTIPHFGRCYPFSEVRVAVACFDHTEDQARRRRPVTMAECSERFELFDANRRAAEAMAAEEAHITQLEEMEKAAKGRKKGGGDA